MNKQEYERLLAEHRDDAAQRPLHEKGIRYEDEPKDLRDVLEGKAKQPGKEEQDQGRER